MKKVFLLFVMIMTSTITTAQDFNIVGKWEGIDPDGEYFALTLDPKGFFCVTNGVEVFGGESVDMGDNIIADFTYEVNMKSEPFLLDFITYNVNDREQYKRYRGYFKIINKNAIEVKQEMFSDNNTWYEDLDIFILKRQIVK